MCQQHHKETTSHKRHGSKLEDGSAHSSDHDVWTRKSFLQTLGFGALGAGLLYNSVPVHAMQRSLFLNRLSTSENERVLVLIQLNGGNDGLNTIIPVTNDIYYQKRPTIAIRKQDSILLSDDIGMHPAMESLRSLWDQGSMSVVNNVGYNNQNRSHGRSTDIWVTASNSNQNLTSGWAGRFLVEDNPSFISNPPEFPLGVRIGGSASIFQSDYGNLGVTFGGSTQFNQFIEQGGFFNENDVPATPFGRSLSYTRRIANASFKYLESIQVAADNAANLGDHPYPDSGLARNLGIVAKLVRGGLQTKVYLVSIGGFDTHNNQGGAEGGHANTLASVANAVRAFYEDLKTDGLDKRVLAMTFSEFGRTLKENGSQGTDHGSSAPVMLFGPVKGGLFGEHANLTELDNSGDPVYNLDYRSVYSSILNDWFELSDDAVSGVIPGGYERLDFISHDPTSTRRPIDLPNHVQLHQNYPNPFNPSTVIPFSLPDKSDVKITVYDSAGRLVSTLAEGTYPAGKHEIRISANGLASGIYMYRLQTSGQTITKQMTLIR